MKIKTFKQALRILPQCLQDGLDLVGQHKTIKDLRFMATTELDLADEGEIELTDIERKSVLTFLERTATPETMVDPVVSDSEEEIMVITTKYMIQSKGRFTGAKWEDSPSVYKTEGEAYAALLERQRYHQTKFAPKFRVKAVEVLEN